MKIALLNIFFFSIISVSIAQSETDLKLLLLEGKYNSIIELLENQSINDSLSEDEYFILGTAYQRLMNFNKAVECFSKANIIKPGNINYLISLGSSNYSAGDYYSAEQNFREVLSIDSTNQFAKIQLANILFNLDEFKDAANIYHALIKLDSTNNYFYSQIGICHYRLSEIDKAKMNLEKSIQLHSTSPRVNSILAKIYSDEKDYERASEILQNCLTQNPRDKTLNKMIADVFYKRKLYHEAIIKYLFVVTLGDTSANTYQRLGMSYYYLSFTNSYILAEPRKLKLEEGIKAFKNAIEKDPDDPISYLYLGLCNKEIENYEMAIANFELALDKCFPEYLDEIYSNLAASHDYSNDYINAIKSYKEALRYQPDKVVTYFYLANLYDRYYKDKEVALLYYQKFINDSFEPDKKLISYSLERIEVLNQENKFWKGIN